VVHMPEYNNMKRLDYFPNLLSEWCQSRIRSSQGVDLLRRLFIYDPERRLTAREALQHKWFHEEPRPTWKYAIFVEVLVFGQFTFGSQCVCDCVISSDSPTSKDNPR
jgi:serine/threonine protein kinase